MSSHVVGCGIQSRYTDRFTCRLVSRDTFDEVPNRGRRQNVSPILHVIQVWATFETSSGKGSIISQLLNIHKFHPITTGKVAEWLILYIP
jgi:hypothetical protein